MSQLPQCLLWPARRVFMGAINILMSLPIVQRSLASIGSAGRGDFVVTPVPRHKLPNALPQRRVGRKARECLQSVRIGIGGGYIPWLHGHELLFGLHAQCILDGCDEFGERLGVVVADVEYPMGGHLLEGEILPR